MKFCKGKCLDMKVAHHKLVAVAVEETNYYGTAGV